MGELFFLGSDMPPVLRGRDAASPNFLEPPTDAHTVWPRVAKFGVATHGEQLVSRGQPCPSN